RLTCPSLASITPELATPGATSAAKPPSATVIWPWLMTVLPCGASSKRQRSLRKSVSLILAVEATRPPTSILELGPNRMPFWLSSSTLPLALSCPRIAAVMPPVTRFKVQELRPGCRKLVVSPEPIEKSPQLMIAFLLDCTVSSWLGQTVEIVTVHAD